MNDLSRREFICTTAAAAAGAGAALAGQTAVAASAQEPRVTRPVVIASGNGLSATQKAMELILAGSDALAAIVAGVNIVEEDPEDQSVGYGGLPNEDGIVELDACVMHGPTARCGSVAALRNIKTPSSVAKLVMERTDHIMLVGEGALRFARAHGFEEVNLLTEKSRQAWLKWKENLSETDDWLAPEPGPEGQQSNAGAGGGMGKRSLPVDRQSGAGGAGGMGRRRFPVGDEQPGMTGGGPGGSGAGGMGKRSLPVWDGRGGLAAGDIPFTYGTINCLAVDAAGNLSGVTSTSGLSYKIPGRVGDSPIIGAGLYVDNEVGAAGATGRGEACIKICGAHTVVELMRRGLSPEEACKEALRRAVAMTTEKRLRREDGSVNYDLTFYALAKDGRYGSASMWSGPKFAVCADGSNRREACGFLYERAEKPE